MPQQPTYRPETAILELGNDFYDPVGAADFPQTILRFRNDKAAAQVGLDGLTDEAWLRHFGRFEPLPGNLEQPLALRYHGHQFRTYNPDLGDGRGFLFAQLRDDRGRLMDLGTKGSGQTPWSRFGDGRLTLKGGMREILATEMLEALGVETSRTFSLIETGEALHRGDEPSPTRSAVMVRLSHGHIRIGSFQRLAYLDERDNLRRLVDYSLRHYFPEDRHCEAHGDEAIHGSGPEDGLLRSARNDGEKASDGEKAVALLGYVVRATARLAASYIAAGFVHGVLNSDNINITAESFDYGPWRWTPMWDGHFTAAYFDHAGLYSFGRQPEAIHWDVVQLAMSLREIAPAEALTEALDAFPELFQTALRDQIFWRLGIVAGDEEEDSQLLVAIEQALAKQTVEIDRFFFDWRGGRRRGLSPADPAYQAAEFQALAAGLERRQGIPAALDHDYWSDAAPCSMHIEEVEAIWARIAEADDWSLLEAKVAAIRRMGEAHRS
ncbi:MAG TPA: YdiU family protein [Allosphingosinicella sp.]|jgi:uncharacterized protein YdiU (UPF0061 family)